MSVMERAALLNLWNVSDVPACDEGMELARLFLIAAGECVNSIAKDSTTSGTSLRSSPCVECDGEPLRSVREMQRGSKEHSSCPHCGQVYCLQFGILQSHDHEVNMPIHRKLRIGDTVIAYRIRHTFTVAKVFDEP
jgi:hypothetical protein